MASPPQLPNDRGKGPFGQAAFLATVALCVVLVVLGAVAVTTADGAGAAVGTSRLVLGALGLLTSGLGLLAEALQRRR